MTVNELLPMEFRYVEPRMLYLLAGGKVVADNVVRPVTVSMSQNQRRLISEQVAKTMASEPDSNLILTSTSLRKDDRGPLEEGEMVLLDINLESRNRPMKLYIGADKKMIVGGAEKADDLCLGGAVALFPSATVVKVESAPVADIA